MYNLEDCYALLQENFILENCNYIVDASYY